MPKSQILSDEELQTLIEPFLPEGFSKDSALALAATACLSMVTEPGDRMAGALARVLGPLELASLLVDGLETKQVVRALAAYDCVEEFRISFGDFESTLADTRQRWLPRVSKSRLEHLLTRSKSLALKLITPDHTSWPSGLNDLQDSAPTMLFVEGNLSCLSEVENAVSIVGSRAATPYGRRVSAQLVTQLAKAKKASVSGGALGIDACVHQFSIDNGISTVAVMAGGLDRKYPVGNAALFNQVRNRGALISEMPPGVAPTRWRFLQRNRLIAALSPTTIVVEAGMRSGSIRTANNALELDRELLAVPGSVFSATSAGTNNLIAENKAVALSDLNNFLVKATPAAIVTTESALAQRAKDAIRESTSMTKSEIAKVAGLTARELELALSELVEQNHVVQDRTSRGELYYALKYAQ
jgi:DNA processing protein